MRRRSIWMALVMVCSMAIALHGPDATAQTAAEFYKGNTITVLVASDAGSGFDIEARAIASSRTCRPPEGWWPALSSSRRSPTG
jgi:tripartite-type tricarboxylate transporter receptor subunit TctC